MNNRTKTQKTLITQSQKIYQKLQKQYSRKINLDLKRINLALEKLGNIHKNIENPINILGSDGKYSTLISLKSFIESSGNKCTFFVSPHLKSVTERIWLKNKFISTDELKNNIKIIQKLNVKLTLFEVLNLAYYISASKIKDSSFSLVEAGLLFKGDSTRVWDAPKCQIVCNINEQHLEWVKPKNLSEIIKQKVAYLSKKTTIYIAKQKPETLKKIKKILKKNPSKKVYYGSGWVLKKSGNKRIYKDKNGKIILKSKKIISDALWDNVALAIKVARDLKISKKNILNAIPNLQFEGRLQYISGKLTKSLNKGEKLLIDGCSSEASAKNLANYLKTIKIPKYGVWSMIKNKNPELFIKQFKGIFEKVITVPIDREESSLPPKLLYKLAKQNGINSDPAISFGQAIKKISSKKKKLICVFGSLYNCGNILNKN